VIGFLGKLIPQKGVHQLIAAHRLLGQRAGPLIVGFGSFREWLAGMAQILESGREDDLRWLEDRASIDSELSADEFRAAAGRMGSGGVRFTGLLDHRYAPYALAAMDVLVVPSILNEAFAMVAAEGAACGALPLVARHSGLTEVAEALESEVGRPRLFSYDPGPGSVHRIAAGLQTLLALPTEERRDLRTRVAAFVAGEWTWDRTATRLLEMDRR
jgi:glycosyltransferase involved in cell wall biosynthesis